jgi:hypothetical protein
LNTNLREASFDNTTNKPSTAIDVHSPDIFRVFQMCSKQFRIRRNKIRENRRSYIAIG